jgi:hypothetical protein
LDHHREVFQSQPIDESFEHRAVLAWREAIASRCVRHAVSWVVHRYATKVAPQRGDYFSIQKGPGGISMQKKKRFPSSLIDIVNPSSIESDEAMLDRKQLMRNLER